MSPQYFQFLQLSTGPFTFNDGDYGPAISAPGGQLAAWADMDLATAWRERLGTLLTNGALRASLYGAIDPNDQGALAKRQMQYMADLSECVANFYNALNIPWDSDPRARIVYRRWIAGDPQGTTVQVRDGALYAQNAAYSSQWYMFNSAWARSDRFDVQTPGDVHGLMPRRARELFLQYFQPNDHAPQHATEFVVSTGLYIDLDDHDTLWPDDALTSNAMQYTRNRSFVLMDKRVLLRGGSNRYANTATPLLPGDMETYRRARQVYARFAEQCIMFGGVGFHGLPAPPNGAWVMTAGASAGVADGTSPPHATDGWLGGIDTYGSIGDGNYNRLIQWDHLNGGGDPGSTNWDDWRCFWWDFPFAGGSASTDGIPLKAIAPLVEYIPMYEQWHAEIAARTPQEVVVQARAFAAYVNMRQIRLAGSPSAFISLVAGADANVQRSLDTPDPTVNAVSSGIAAFGAAIATVGGPYGAAIGLVAGAVAGVMKVFNAVAGDIGLRGASATNYRDDTGRWKPRIQPGWLQGSPNEDDGPQMYVEAPPGWTRPIRISLGPIDTTPGAYLPGHLPPTRGPIPGYDSTSGMGKAPLVAMAAVGAAVLFWFSQRKS